MARRLLGWGEWIVRLAVAEIRTGVLGDPAARADYRAEWLGDAFIERLIWSAPAEPVRLAGVVIAEAGYVWFRFWMRNLGTVTERFYAADGTPVGTRMNVCTLPVCDEAGCRARDLLLFLWLAPDGRVTVYNEDAFEQAARDGLLTGEQVKFAEAQVRELTAAVARGRFPPSLVRNWRIDPRRISSLNQQ
jgi:predicted RNA-binding protein associated with RNAse of E/G family